jgi:hypothetical protein
LRREGRRKRLRAGHGAGCGRCDCVTHGTLPVKRVVCHQAGPAPRKAIAAELRRRAIIREHPYWRFTQCPADLPARPQLPPRLD